MYNFTLHSEKYNLQSFEGPIKNWGCKKDALRTHSEKREFLSPPINNMGVKSTLFDFTQTEIPSWHVDYLTVTIWGDWALILPYLRPLGSFEFQGHGSRFYRRIFSALLDASISDQPYSQDDSDISRFTLVLPGTACQALGFEGLKNLYQAINRFYGRHSISRLDLAFNKLSFTVDDFMGAVKSNHFRSYTRRAGKSMRYFESIYQKQETGEKIGCKTFYFGSRTSERMIRIYDTHGYTRLELESKNDRAELIAADIFIEDDSLRFAIGHLRDFVDILEGEFEKRGENKLCSWWAEFVSDNTRLYSKIIKKALEVTVKSIQTWLERQVSCALVALKRVDMDNRDFMFRLYELGEARIDYNPRYKSLIKPQLCF